MRNDRWFIGTIAAIFAVLCTLTSCKDDDPAPKPGSFIRQFRISGTDVSVIKSFTDVSEDKLINSFTVNIGQFVVPEMLQDRYTPLMELRKKYNDNHFTGTMDEDMRNYMPLTDKVMKIAIMRSNRKNWEAEFPEDGGDLADHFRIRFKTYYPFLTNDYKWPEGENSPWHEMSIKEFNELNGVELMDCAIQFIPDEFVRATWKEEYEATNPTQPDSPYSHYYSYIFQVKARFADGTIARGDCELHNIPGLP